MEKVKQSCLVLMAFVITAPVLTHSGYTDLLYIDRINSAHAESNSTVELLDMSTEPAVVHVGDSFRISAKVMNNTPDAITFPSLCESPLSTEFDGNVMMGHTPACLGFSMAELKSGESTTITGPSSGIVYHASSSGITNAVLTFAYAIQNKPASVSKPFTFIIQERKHDIITEKMGTGFQLKIDQTAVIESQNIEVRFLDVVGDSRCPADVVCIWEGAVTISVNVMKDNQNLGDFNLTSPSGNEDSSTITFDGYSVHMINVEPYPKSTDKIERSDYVATMVVSEIRTQQSVSAVMKIVGQSTLLAIKNVGNTEVHGVKIKADDGPIKYAKARGWDSDNADANTVHLQTSDRPLTKDRIMVVLLKLDNKYSGLEWTAVDVNDDILSSGALIANQSPSEGS